MSINVLVACEESQAITTRLRAKGINAFSCDIQECSGGHPEWHIKMNVVPLLNGYCTFTTMDGTIHKVDGKWHTILAFPPCTHLAVSGARHFEQKRKDGRQLDGIKLFCSFFEADCDRVMIENPVNIISGDYIKYWFPDIAKKYNLPIKPTQYIQPYEYGDKSRKKTCLWIKGLPILKPTKIVEPELEYYTKKDGRVTSFSKGFSSGFKQERGKVRSKTYPGIANAIVEQWF